MSRVENVSLPRRKSRCAGYVAARSRRVTTAVDQRREMKRSRRACAAHGARWLIHEHVCGGFASAAKRG